MADIDWYFDFISPFPYLQSELLHILPSDVTIHSFSRISYDKRKPCRKAFNETNRQ